MTDHQDEHQMDERLRALAQGYNAPPPTPRDEMWARITAERRRRQALPERAVKQTPLRVRRWIPAGAALAATLLIGVLIGRVSTRDAGNGEPPQTVASAGGEQGSAAIAPMDAAYRVATLQHFTQAEVLLTSFRSEARSGEVAADVEPWARELLTSTRLLLDTPAGTDPRLGPLLERLELVLAQIVQLPAPDDQAELRLIYAAMEQGDVLMQLRAAGPSGPERQISGD